MHELSAVQARVRPTCYTTVWCHTPMWALPQDKQTTLKELRRSRKCKAKFERANTVESSGWGAVGRARGLQQPKQAGARYELHSQVRVHVAHPLHTHNRSCRPCGISEPCQSLNVSLAARAILFPSQMNTGILRLKGRRSFSAGDRSCQ
jgi:hypothetical protein